MLPQDTEIKEIVDVPPEGFRVVVGKKMPPKLPNFKGKESKLAHSEDTVETTEQYSVDPKDNLKAPLRAHLRADRKRKISNPDLLFVKPRPKFSPSNQSLRYNRNPTQIIDRSQIPIIKPSLKDKVKKLLGLSKSSKCKDNLLDMSIEDLKKGLLKELNKEIESLEKNVQTGAGALANTGSQQARQGVQSGVNKPAGQVLSESWSNLKDGLKTVASAVSGSNTTNKYEMAKAEFLAKRKSIKSELEKDSHQEAPQEQAPKEEGPVVSFPKLPKNALKGKMIPVKSLRPDQHNKLVELGAIPVYKSFDMMKSEFLTKSHPHEAPHKSPEWAKKIYAKQQAKEEARKLTPEGEKERKALSDKLISEGKKKLNKGDVIDIKTRAKIADDSTVGKKANNKLVAEQKERDLSTVHAEARRNKPKKNSSVKPKTSKKKVS